MARGSSLRAFTQTGAEPFLNNFVMPTWEPIWLVLCALRRPTAECPAVGSSGESTSPKFPPGQAKYVTCVQGAILDVVVDLRVCSPGYALGSGTARR